MAMWHKTIYKVKIIPIKILKAFFTIIEKIIPKFAWKLKRLQIGKMTLRKRKIWRYHASEFQTKLQSHSNKNHTCVETQKIPSSQKNLEKEKQSWKYDTLWFQITAGPPNLSYAPWIQPILDWNYSEKNPESSKKQNLNLLHSGNYLHSIYILFTNIYKALHCIRY